MEALVSGALMLKQREAMERLVGKDLVRSVIDTLPIEIADAYTSMGPLSRVRADWVEEVYVAVADAAHRDVLRMHREIVRISVEESLRSVWRVLLRFTSDDALVRRTQLIFSKGLSRGKLSARIIRPGTAEVRLTDWPGASDLQINGIAAAVQAVLRCAGRQNVRSEAHSTLDGACILATWLA